ncbi:enoyl-CoA hydratase/isomerase family protein [Wenjunlia tyrosinilytica]|uniref:Enoyl-CoA hydratase n=1 Tax=Wenjunlia tyrosinilytica TaxID=1544741 RepID=A0A918DVX4_9ACTN|nr:enoyl-CoA hydratase/isomerase family protein [Wenjunlia tyrosinilytica]GGO86727.1 enoyl-CoA hydratase [Wenjunlia tyrosinilytica]
MSAYSTLLHEVKDGVATVTLNRPERHNAFDLTMVDEVNGLWRALRYDDDVRVVVLTGAGDRAFCTGIDRSVEVPQPSSPFMVEDPALRLGPKSADLWKPVIAAVNGMACGGAFYLLGECEFIIAAEHATFFDPHTTYGMVNAFEAVHLAQRMPLGEVMRLALLGTAERMSARRAYENGLVSEVVPAQELPGAAARSASVIAGYPPEAVQGTVRAVWAAREMTRSQALATAPHLVRLGNLPADRQEGLFASRSREFRIR